MKQTTLSIIAERYLDTEHTIGYIKALEAELRKRKVTGIKRWALEYLAASSLWWNIIFWEWSHFDGSDIFAGWRMNLILFSITSLIITFIFTFKAGIINFFVLHVVTTTLGFLLRQGSKM